MFLTRIILNMKGISLKAYNRLGVAAILLCFIVLLGCWNASKRFKLPTSKYKVNNFRKFQDGTKVYLEQALKNATTKYTIVVWEPPFGNKAPHDVDASTCGSCEVVYDQQKVSDITTKAVVIHFNELNLKTLPKTRRNDQLYIWWAMEAPPAIRVVRGWTLTSYDALFNLTMSHRRDSDVYTPYGDVANILKSFRKSGSGNPVKDVSDLVAKKSKMALWVVSNCGFTDEAIKRKDYSSVLIAAGLDLERKGRCFPDNGPVKSINIAKDYKFYMAFENGYHCIDYITEKLFRNAFLMESVPVVMGSRKEDYEALLPPRSYIYAEDFKSPIELVNYLKHLDSNDTAYKEYFKWRTLKPEDMPQYNRTRGFCQICRILHGINIDNLFNPKYDKLYSDIPLFGYPNRSRVVQSLHEWFYGSETRECLPKY